MAVVVVVLGLMLAPFLLLAAPQESAAVGHVRLCNRMLVDIAERAAARSRTFQRLMLHLEDSSVIVYVRIAQCPLDTKSCLHFLAADDAGVRTLRISMSWPPMAPAERAGVLAHELRHADEVADAPEVVDLASFGRLFERLGWRGRAGYETCEGGRIARQVEREYAAGVRPAKR